MTASQATPSQKLMLWALALLLVSLLVHARDLSTPGLLDRSGRVKGSDYARLYVTGALADEGRWSELFDPSAHTAAAKARIDSRFKMAGLIPNYGPTAAWLLAPLSRIPFLTSWTLFAAGSSAALLIGVWVLAGQTPALQPYKLLALVAAAANPAVFETIRYGQLSAVTTLFFVIAIVLDGKGRSALSGLVLGLAFYKPNLILPAALIWTISRQWRLLAGLCLGVLIHLSVGILAAGAGVTGEWFGVLLSLARNPLAVQGFPEDVHSFQGFWRLLGADGVTLKVLSATLSLVAIGLASHVWRRSDQFEKRWAALILATLLLSPHLLTYDLLLLVPVVLLSAAAWAGRGQLRRLRWIVLGALYFASLASPLVARLTHFQASTLLMLTGLGLLWWRTGEVGLSSSSPHASS